MTINALRYRRGVATAALAVAGAVVLAGYQLLPIGLTLPDALPVLIVPDEEDPATAADTAASAAAATAEVAPPIRIIAPDELAALVDPPKIGTDAATPGPASALPEDEASPANGYVATRTGDVPLGEIRIEDQVDAVHGWLASGQLMLSATGPKDVYVSDGSGRAWRRSAADVAVLSGLHIEIDLPVEDTTMLALGLRNLGIYDTPDRVEVVFTERALHQVLALQARLVPEGASDAQIARTVVRICEVAGDIGLWGYGEPVAEGADTACTRP